MISTEPEGRDARPERLGTQLGLQGLGRLIALCLNMATFAVILSGLTPAEYGSAAFAITLAEVAGTVAAFGIDKSVFRDLSIGTMDGRRLGAAFLLRLGLAAGVGCLAILVVLALPDSSTRGPMILAFAAMPIACLVTLQQVLRAHVRLIPFAIADVAGSALALAFVIAFSLRGLSAVDVVASSVLPNLIVWLALAVVACRQLRPRFTPTGFGHDARGLFQRSRMFGVGDVTVVAYYRADVVALGITTGGSALGVYAAAYRFVDIAMYGQSIVIGAFFPRIARAWSDLASLRRLLSQIGGFLLALATIAFVSVVTLGPWVIEAFGGSSYGDITVLVAILMTATAVMFINRLLIQALIAGGYGARQVLCWMGGLTGAALAFPLSAFFGARGTGVAVLIGETLILGIAVRQLGSLGALPRISLPRADAAILGAAVAAALVAATLPDPARLVAGALLALATGSALLLKLRRRGLVMEV